jgi:serine-type D-Ala-D-Ala carboxypeptidase/endopeptidase (penicillin-binding protein 4)
MIAKTFLAVFLVFACLFAGCRNAAQPADSNVSLPETAEFDVPASNINLSRPLEISQKPEDLALCRDIDQIIEKSEFSNARWGVMAVSLRDGRVVCGRDGRKLFNPASIEKTLTSIVALDMLGPDFHWQTSVYSEKPAENGVINGSVTLYGGGAPDFGTEELDNLASQLQAKGVKHITGEIIGDDSYFRGDTIGDGWTWNELQWYYGAEASALTFNENEASISVENGSPRPSTDYIHVTAGGATSNRNTSGEASGIKRGLDNNDFYVWGNEKNFGARIAVHDPAGLAARTFKEALEKKGITVDGGSRSRDWKSPDRLDVSGLQPIAAVQSQTLGEIVRKMNKHSVNLFAELILRTLGRHFGDTIPAEIQRPQNVRGDDTAGAALVKKWLGEHHVATEEIEIADGSGLSRMDFVTPEAFTRALIWAAQSRVAKVFTDSLPIAGTDGTLGGRLTKVRGKVIAKTGTVTFVNSLTGYAATDKGEVISFAIISNNDTHRKSGITGIIDAVALAIAGVKIEPDKEKETPTPKDAKNSNDNQNGFYELNLSPGR